MYDLFGGTELVYERRKATTTPLLLLVPCALKRHSSHDEDQLITLKAEFVEGNEVLENDIANEWTFTK